MDGQPRVTRARARVVQPEDDMAPARRSTSLRHSILGPPPDARLDAHLSAEAPATPPPTQSQPFVQPAWVVPRLNGEDALQARNAIRNSRSASRVSTPAVFAPDSPHSPNYPEIRGPATLDSPMAQDYPQSDEEWLGVAVSHPYEPNGAFATSGEEGLVPSHRSHPSRVYSPPGEDGYMRPSPHSGRQDSPHRGSAEQGHDPLEPLELSPSVRMLDFVEVPVRPPTDSRTGAPPRGPFRDPSLVLFPGQGLQPAPDILPHRDSGSTRRGRTQQSEHHQHRRPRARTREHSPGPDFGAHLRRSSRSLSPAAHYAPARFDASSLRVGRNNSREFGSAPAAAYPSDPRLTEQRVPVKNGRRFKDPRQGEISSSVPAAMLNQVNPLVISALRTGWPAFISLNYFSRRMSEVGKSSVTAGGETWDVDDAGQVKFKSKRLKELSFEAISRRDWDSISKNMPRALMDYFIPPGECGVRSELACEIAYMFKRFFDMLSDQPDFYEAYESFTPSGSLIWR
ncbi:hypothetical protein C8R41DRAFT_869382 [Lentinula lateritia]|uniref:Uncharacterized protein n=1 Tax=Lentinula lateritia TaxID=40482 RepID=A0ABQ8V7Y7_9AGAR|nr:hypothetical protein C8R41DRAFT_869382 [Lentinula lateritia]